MNFTPRVPFKLLKLGIILPFFGMLGAWIDLIWLIPICATAGFFIGIADYRKNPRLAWICIAINGAFLVLWFFMYLALYQAPVTTL